jgi:hypothetical protein
MTIAGIDDYYAALVLFQQHNWDMGPVMDQWMQHGLRSAPNAVPGNVRRRRTFQAPELLHDDRENLWATGRPFGTVAAAPDAQDLLDAAEDYRQGRYAHRNGWFINFRRDPAVHVGVMNPSRMGLLWIRQGAFKLIWYGDRAPAEDPARPRQALRGGQTETFDWNNPWHIAHLGGRASSQWFRRFLGETTRVPGDAYQDDENQWLWQWHNDRFFEYMQANPGLWDMVPHPGTSGTWNGSWIWIRQGYWDQVFDLPRLVRDFNNRFTQQIHLPGMNGQPRQARNDKSLDIQRRRIKEICDDFGFEYRPAHRTLSTRLPPHDDNVDDPSEGPSEPHGTKHSRDEDKDGEEEADAKGYAGEGAERPPKRRKSESKGKCKSKARDVNDKDDEYEDVSSGDGDDGS